jgi:hypothetical protein
VAPPIGAIGKDGDRHRGDDRDQEDRAVHSSVLRFEVLR